MFFVSKLNVDAKGSGPKINCHTNTAVTSQAAVGVSRRRL